MFLFQQGSKTPDNPTDFHRIETTKKDVVQVWNDLRQ